ncbi:MAG: hypothetical protein HZA54_13185 [Planctomycetes bacterium]|nr:hypothetical protein [Planctomycetota bacterium]
MDNLYDRAQRQKGAFETLLENVPGYKGYADKESRRDCDKLEREAVAKALTDHRDKLRAVVATLTGSGNLEALAPIERLEKAIDRLFNMVRFANYGYSGFFDTVKVDDRELNRVYEFDLTLREKSGALPAAFAELAATASASADAKALEPKVSALTALLGDMEKTMAERERILRGG